MKLGQLVGLLLVVLGVVALTYQGFTFWTTERAAQVGPFAIDVQRPVTIVFHPILGVVALILGAFMLMSGRQRTAI